MRHHHHGHEHGHKHGQDHQNPHPHPHGHNHPARAVQWQTPHLPPGTVRPQTPAEPDLDLVETAFLEGFSRAPDPVSFLRLAGIPFVGLASDGLQLHLLRVETQDRVDVGAVMPLVGGSALRYDPLPAKMTSRRRHLTFVYHDGTDARSLSFAQARALAPLAASGRIAAAD
jgi:hypothetical protein